jgi:predicted nuclease of predicted toxin-antitoxin system
MKLLFDQNISYRIVKLIEGEFPGAAHVISMGLGNSSDQQIWEYALKNKFTIVTFDADFYNLSLVWGHPPKIIWIRTMNQSTRNIELLLKRFYTSIHEFLNDTEFACLEILQPSTQP